MSENPPKVLITGASGQIGTELTHALQKRYGASQVIATDLRPQESGAKEDVQFYQLDVMDKEALTQLVKTHQVDTIYHLAALLSAVGEKVPHKAWDININGSLHVLEVARELNLKRVFIPSSIAAFGPSTPLDNTPQDTIQRPTTMYGVTKVAGELLAEYYFKRFGVDCRGVRFPGLISYTAPPGGGTTDYAVEIFHYALKGENYTCYLKEDTSLDMMYMPDALEGCIQLMEADSDKLKHRNAFNITAMHFTPAELTEAIRKHIPDFTCTYEPEEVRQGIADSWPNYMDDSAAREEWGWAPKYDLDMMVEDMIKNLRAQHQ